MEGLPIDVLSKILRYTNSSRNQLLQLRLLSTRMNAAVVNIRDFWRNMLGRNGPMMIGPDSMHRKHVIGKCKMNKEDRCYIASHYYSPTLIPRFPCGKAYDAYKVAIRLYKKKFVRKAEVEEKRLKRKLEHITLKYEQQKAEYEDEIRVVRQRIDKHK